MFRMWIVFCHMFDCVVVTLDVAGASVLVGATDHHIKGMAWVDVYAPAGVLVINEIFQNPLLSGDTPGEWFEIKNVSGIDLDLAGWTISDADFDAHVMDPANGTTVIPAGGLLVLGQSTDTVANGGAAVDYAYGTADFFLANGADEVQLLSPDGVMVDDVEYDDGATFPDPNGFSMELDPGSQDAASNDDGTNWCETSAASYGVGGSGSPGVENGGCP